jgi:hypothetical protein
MWPRIMGWFNPDFVADVDEAIKRSDAKWLDIMLGGERPS